MAKTMNPYAGKVAPAGDQLATKRMLQGETVQTGELSTAYAEAKTDAAVGDIAEAIAGQPGAGVGDIQSRVEGMLGGIGQAAEDSQAASTVAQAAQNGVASLNTALALQGGRPLWDGIDNTGDSSMPFVWAREDVPVTAVESRLAFVRIAKAGEKQVLSFIGRRVGDIGSMYFDVFRVVDGVAHYAFTSADTAYVLGTKYTHWQVSLPGVAMQYGEIWAVQARITGPGTAYLAGTTTIDADNAIFRPFQLGGVRDPRGTPAPATITQAQLDVMYRPTVFFVQLGGDDTALEAPRTIQDDFSGDLSRWVLSSSGSTLATINSAGQYAYNGTTGGAQAGIYRVALKTDQYNCAAYAIGVNSQPQYLVAGSDGWIDRCVGARITNGAVDLGVLTGGVGSVSNYAVKASGTGGGDGVWTVTRDADNVWRLFKGVSTELGTERVAWADTENESPRGEGNRYFGVSCTRSLLASSGRWDNFVAKDVTQNYS
ncbi:minor tail protein [Gordonia phage Schmidt]|uniref:Minor tail protein n=1 Tax=Gordonia phage Schmidt TaxID=2301697 RepID=A0A385E365_9CAUD|nr:minor tail protein [Gordonia phage Schmidt]AXQ65149.1 minor tail protein [Gordonia phage Schmidt]